MKAVATTKQSVPTTGRTPHFLARQYGYNTVQALADSLPRDALVLDIGAGVSFLGHKVASLRPDVRWVNIDLCYANQALLASQQKSAPRNLTFLAGNIVDVTPNVRRYIGKADRVFSYWLLPHLSLQRRVIAEQAVGNMYDLLKTDGQLFVGPVRQSGILSWFYYKDAVTCTRQTPRQKVADRVARDTQLHWLPRIIQSFGNRHNLHIGNHIIAFVHRQRVE